VERLLRIVERLTKKEAPVEEGGRAVIGDNYVYKKI
jgi:hypothetical protein